MKNEKRKDIALFNFLLEQRAFFNEWEVNKTENKQVQAILDKASKRNTGNRGEPDLIYVNEHKRLLILIENKDSVTAHVTKNRPDPTIYAVDGAKHYLKFFTQKELEKLEETQKNYFKNWKILGLAVSGDIDDVYMHRIDTFFIKEGEVLSLNNNSILNEDEYIALFENIDVEKIIERISKSSNNINQLLRNIDSQKRPIVLSSLMICLFDNKDFQNDFKDNFMSYRPATIITNIPNTVDVVLEAENLPKDKIQVLKNQFASAIQDDADIKNTDLLKDILIELQNNVIPLFKTNTNYDIIGKFYEEFLKYAGVTNIKNGIVLTPRHITELFTELTDIKLDDVIFDPTCGTGAFLVSGMNKILEAINTSKIKDKQKLRDSVKEKQLLGIEKNPTMFALSVSNMLFRGDGKSRIHNIDFFSDEADRIINKIKPTIGFMNPPYGGLDSKKKNPTKKEIQFLCKLLDSCSRYVVIISPLSVYFKEAGIRNSILEKHTLKCVINMPKELFQPNASTHTAIAVFETNKPHKGKEVLLYDLKDDGFVLSKHKGRTDVLNKWNSIKKKLFKELEEPDKYTDTHHFVKTKIHNEDEWIIQAHSKTDYSRLDEKNFLDSIKEYIIFKTKKDMNLLDKDLNELDIIEILNNSGIDGETFFENGD